MDNDAQTKKPSAPYIAWRTFTSFIGNIHGKVPLQVDPSILRNLSGTARSQLISALKSLDLIDDDGIVQDSLKKLADAFNTPQWKSVLGEFLTKAYSRIIGNLDITAATPAMLRERFRSNGNVEGGTVDLALRFYLSGLKEAEIPFSEHFAFRQRAPRGSSTRRRATASKAEQGKEADGADGLEPPEGTFEISFEVLGLDGSVFLPEDVSQERWEAISEYVKMVIGYRQKAQAKA
jgi:hypothetical protein